MESRRPEALEPGLIAGVYSFFANPSGGKWNDPCEIEKIWSPGENSVKTNFYRQLDRMAANLQWLKDRGVPIIYTPFVESDDRNKWHAKQGGEAIIRLYRLVHDYFQHTRKLDHIIWAYHTTQNSGALESCYPGDNYVDVLGKSAYGSGLVFSEYDWAVQEKRSWQNHLVGRAGYPRQIRSSPRLPGRAAETGEPFSRTGGICFLE